MEKNTTPWKVYDLMTSELLGSYESEYAAAVKHRGQPVTIQYRPRARSSK